MAIFVVILLITCALSAYFVYRILNYEPDNDEPIGFTKDTVMKGIGPSTGTQRGHDPRPAATTTSIPTYNLAMQWTFQNDSIYEMASSAVEVSLQNFGNWPVYAYQIGITWSWPDNVATYEEAAGILIGPNEERYLGMLAYSGPAAAGYCSYVISVRLLAQTGSGEWTDLGEVKNSRRYVEALALEDRTSVDNVSNPEGYFQLVNGLFQDRDWVGQKAMQKAGNSTDAPDAYQLCRLFDFIRANMTYICDPLEDENEWITPKQALLRGGGDCEDQAITLAALAASLGATVRCHFTTTHSFASVFCGDEGGLDNATTSISNYYGMVQNTPNLVHYHDMFGYWLYLDPIAGFYPGAPPLGCAPVRSGDSSYDWSFTGTDHVISIDITEWP